MQALRLCRNLPNFRKGLLRQISRHDTIPFQMLGRTFSGASSQDRVCYNLSSWFRIPEQGMEKFEILGRASAFFLATPGDPLAGEDDTASRPMIQICTSAHVIHPFRYLHYYPDVSWLKFVQDEHVMAKLEVSTPQGEIIHEYQLDMVVHRHDQRDLAMLQLIDSDETVERLASDGHLPRIHELEEVKELGEDLEFHGHRLVESKESGELVQVPAIVKGRFMGRSKTHTLASTESRLEMGMCGGPVFNRSGKVIAMTEGIVGDGGPEPLRGMAVVVETPILAAFAARVRARALGLEPEEATPPVAG